MADDLARFLGAPVLEGKQGQGLRAVIGALQGETHQLDELCKLLSEKALALQSAVSNTSFALHDFSRAVVLLTGAPQGPSAAATDAREETSVMSLLAPVERSGLLETADAFNTLAAAMQTLEEGLRTQLSQPLAQLRGGAVATFSSALQDAAEARLELESEGKKTAVQMSKKHQQAERRASDVSFGDLLKIQQSLKSVEKRFETSAQTHLSTMLKLRAQRHSLLVANMLAIQGTLADLLASSAQRFRDARERSAELAATQLPQFVADFESETPRRDAAVARAVSDCCNGTATHVEGYLSVNEQGKKSLIQERKYFVVANGRLTSYANWATYEPDSEQDLLLFTARPTDGNPMGFEVQSPALVMSFEAPTEAKRNKWLQVLAENISSRLDAQKQTGASKGNSQDEQKKREVLDAIRALPGNAECADCDATEPTWVSLNYGVVICHQCSGVHRKIGAHISKVRSLTLDVIDDELLQFMMSFGNTVVNSLLEASLTRKKPSNASKREVRDEFVVAKYATRAFAVQSAEDSVTLSARLYKALHEGDAGSRDLLSFIIMGANLKWTHESGNSLLHAALMSPAVKCDPLVLTQLLVYNDAALEVRAGEQGRTPLHVAASRNFVESCRVLVRNGANVNAVTTAEETPLDLLPAAQHPKKDASENLEVYLFPQLAASVARRNSLLSSAERDTGSPTLPRSGVPMRGTSGTTAVASVADSPGTARKGTRRLSLFGRSSRSPGSPTASPTASRKKESASALAKRMAGGGDD